MVRKETYDRALKAAGRELERQEMRAERDALAAEVAMLREALAPFPAALRIAREAFAGPADNGHLRAVAFQYLGVPDLMASEAALSRSSTDWLAAHDAEVRREERGRCARYLEMYPRRNPAAAIRKLGEGEG